MQFRRALVAVLGAAAAQEAVRGVAPEDQHLYTPDAEGQFACVSAPWIKIPADRVNDDYCDCPDGSDEPGTAACANGRFWCAGSAQYIPSRLVGDGVCDYDVCCDGSDETPGLCPDRCAEVKARQAAERAAREAYLAEGVQIRASLVEQAKARKAELASGVKELTARVPKLEAEVAAARDGLAAAEEADAASGADAESVQALGALREALRDADEAFEQLVSDFLAVKDAYLDLDAAIDTMSTEYNPNFNDPAVKDVIRKWRDAAKPRLSAPEGRDLRADMELLDKIKVAGDAPQGRSLASLLPRPLSSLFGKRAAGGASSGARSGASSGPRAQAAREHVDALLASLDETRQALKVQSKLLELDSGFWGDDEVGRSAEDACVSTQKGDFTYEACLFGTSVQLDGRNTVQLGTSTGLKWSGANYNIEFVNGDVCPNGVARSTTMMLECAHDTEALSVDEVETCHYVLRVATPLVCGAPQNPIVHDEL